MDFMFLPDGVKKILDESMPGKTPISVLRTNGNLSNEPGEGYVVAYDDQAYFFSRGIGKSDYESFDAHYSMGMNKMSVRKERFDSFLDVDIDGNEMAIKFSSYEEKDLEPMLKKWQEANGAAPPAVPDEVISQTTVAPPPIPATSTAEPPPIPEAAATVPPPIPPPTPTMDSSDHVVVAHGTGLSPIAGMAAALMFLATVDDELDKSEDDYIRKVCRDDQQVLQEGLTYYKENSFEDLLKELSGLDRTQKLCVVANMFEMGMIDGVLHRSEQRLIQQLVQGLEVGNDEHQAIKDVLLLKNQVSVLY